jgi:multidrug transporter EmrE-like cation transporter
MEKNIIIENIISKIKNFTDNSIVDEIIVLAMIVAFVESVAQNTLKTSNKGTVKFVIGILFYMLVGYVLHYAYHHVPLSRLNVTWSCISIILAIFIGYTLYNEKMNIYSILSVISAIIAIYFSKLSSEY